MSTSFDARAFVSRFTKPFVLEPDVCDAGIEAVLSR